MGYAAVDITPDTHTDLRFNNGLDEARRMLRLPLNMKRLSITSRFNTILTQQMVSTVYQPILDFKSGTILGWEALTRGPENTSFHSPVILFETAEKLGRLFALEKLCRESAIANVGELDEQKLFLNIHPKPWPTRNLHQAKHWN